MSAVILPFKGEWQGNAAKPEKQDTASKAEARAFRDARLIRAAKIENDDWTARLLLAMLETLDRTQLTRLEFRLMGPHMNSEGSVQALAVVQLATGNKAHKDRVRSYLDRIAAGEVE